MWETLDYLNEIKICGYFHTTFLMKYIEAFMKSYANVRYQKNHFI